MEEIHRTSYYPFGGIIATDSLSFGRDIQNRTYNAKEQDFANNLFWLDYGARQYDPTRGLFTTYDPHCESYYNTNPLTYCGNNPISKIDPTGMDWYENADGSAAFWQEGSEETVTVGGVTYKNAGPYFKINYDWGYIVFDQQNAEKPVYTDGYEDNESFGCADMLHSIGTASGYASTYITEYSKLGYNTDLGYWRSARGKTYSFNRLQKQENGKYILGAQGYKYSRDWAYRNFQKMNTIGNTLGRISLLGSAVECSINPTTDNKMSLIENIISTLPTKLNMTMTMLSTLLGPAIYENQTFNQPESLMR